MNRDYLRNLGLTDEQVKDVMAENGKDISSEKKKYESLKNDSEKLIEAEKKIADLQKVLDESNEKMTANNTLLAERDAQIKQYELGSVKTKVAAEMGFSLDAINFLQGEDEESIRNSAESLKSLIGTRTAPLASSESALTSEQAALKGMLNNLF